MPGVATTRHVTYARYTVAGTTHAVATDDGYRAGIWHESALADDAQLAETWIESVAQGNTLTLRVLDRADLVEELLAEDDTPLLTESGDRLYTEFGPHAALAMGNVSGLQVTVETVTSVTYDDSTTAEFVAMQTLTCTGRERQAGCVVLSLVDVEDVRLNTLWPPHLYRTTDFPLLSDANAGRAIPHIVGLADKIECVRINNASPWRFAVAQTPLSVPTVLTVYRGSSPADARVVPPAEYTTGSTAGTAPVDYLYIDFVAEQRDFSGTEYRIFADVQTFYLNPDPPELIRTLIQAVGGTVNVASFAAASTFCFDNSLFVHCDFGREGQRAVRAIIEDLLWVARATLRRNATGEYAILCDGAGASVATYDEDAGDDIEVKSVAEAAQPASVGIRYRPSPRDPAALQFVLSRAVPGGTQGDERPRELRYVRRHDTADRCAYYRMQRAVLSARLRASIYRVVHGIGDVITVSSNAYGLSADTWRVRNVRRIAGGCEVEATPYSPALIDYAPGALPGDAGVDYTPDYSATPPASPTSMRITAGGTSMASDGPVTARVTVDAIPPAINWRELWFAAVHNVTGEIPSLLTGSDIGGGRYGVTLTGLRPGEVYKLLAYAVNPLGVQGVVLSTFNATAIGGGNPVSTFTAPGYAVLPGNVAAITVTQGSAKLLNVAWTAVTTPNLREYVLERRIGAFAYSEVWRGQATSYVDRDVIYATTYQYRVRARDTFGNFSAVYTTSLATTLTTGTLSGGATNNDIGSSTVGTVNRTNMTTITASMGSLGAPIWYFVTVAHSLGKIPVATVRGVSGVPAIAGIRDVDVSNVDLVVLALETQTSVNTVAGDPHRHNLVGYAGLPFAFSVSIYVW